MTPDSLLSGHAKSEEQHRREICIAGRWMYERGHIVACEGNISVRLDDDTVLTTPTCMNKGMLAPEDLVITDLNGRQVAGDRKFSSELAGGPVLLSSREVAKLIAARARYFVTPPPGGGAELPETNDTGESSSSHVSLTRNELDALIDEAVRKDRARR